MGSWFVRQALKAASAEINLNSLFSGRELSKANAREVFISHQLLETWILSHTETAWEFIHHGASWEFVIVSLYLVSESIVANSLSGICHLLDQDSDLVGVFGVREHEIRCNGLLLVSRKIRLIEGWDFVEMSELPEGTEEVVSRHGSLALEERQPEDL